MRRLFLDLEDTVVEPLLDGWFNWRLISKNIELIRSLGQFDAVHIFSFAVHNHFDASSFELGGLKAALEKQLGMSIERAPCVDHEIIPTVARAHQLNPGSISFADMSDFWGKEHCFDECMISRFSNIQCDTECVLVDDAVRSKTTIIPVNNFKLTITQMRI